MKKFKGEIDMFYLLYIIISVIIILAVDVAITLFWALHDTLANQEKKHFIYKDQEVSFAEAIKRYYGDYNSFNKLNDLFNL